MVCCSACFFTGKSMDRSLASGPIGKPKKESDMTGG